MSIELIASTIKALDAHSSAPVDNTSIIATPHAQGQIAEIGEVTATLIRNLISLSRTLCVSADGSIVPSAAGQLKKQGIVLHTVKMSSLKGTINALVYFWTKQGIIVIYQHPLAATLSNMLNWGVPPQIKEVEVERVVERVVEKEVQVPAPVPQGFRARLKFLFS